MDSSTQTLRKLPMRGIGLERLAAFCESLDGVWRSSLQWGDRVIVFTRNSVYTLHAVEDQRFIVSGGWFDRKYAGPTLMNISGCTWGGAAINRKLVAAPGLHIEFGNGVVTTEIQRVVVARYDEKSDPN